MTDASALVVVGGFPGTGKTALARRLSTELGLPWLCSDTTGSAIRRTLGGQVEAGEAFRAGYEVLFNLTEEFLRLGCSVIVDMSMGWEFQWERLDGIRRDLPRVAFVPVILRCPYQTCVERIEERHRRRPDAFPPAERFFAQPQLPKVWEYLESLDRPDICVIDGGRDPEQVFRDAMRRLQGRLRR